MILYTIDEAESEFNLFPCFHTARKLAIAVCEYTDDGIISASDCASILARLEPWLKGLFQ